jgi:thiosulfate/3-mercaptopyruvate sulfurtransferase
MGKVWMDFTDLNNQNVRFIDVRFSLTDSQVGRHMYEENHIKDAIFMDLENDMSNMKSGIGRHPMPSKEKLETYFETHGLQYSDTIVIYDQGGMPFAPRAYWIFKYAGFPNVYILKQGFEKLQELNVTCSKELPDFQQSHLDLEWNEEIFADKEMVKLISDQNQEGVLLDARSKERYEGKSEPIDFVAGHIPKARNFDWEQLKENGQFKSSQDIEKLIEKVASKNEDITVYCGSGVTAAPLYAMLKEIGYERVKLYVGSYSDWISTYPVDKK